MVLRYWYTNSDPMEVTTSPSRPDIPPPPSRALLLVGYTRVEARKHDWTDVSAGAVLGIASNWFFTTRRPDQEVSLYKDGDRLGIRFTMALQ